MSADTPWACDDLSVGAEELSDETVDSLLSLARAALAEDGTDQLSEQAVLRLRHASPGTTHAVARDADGTVLGYLQLVDEPDAALGELVVAPAARRRGVGTALAAWAVGRIGVGRTARAWAHGNGPGAVALAAALDFAPTRVLFQMRRPAADPLPAVTVPAGVRIRTFRPGADDEDWVRANALAFAHHPEQGRLTVADLHERMAEDWFDPAGFFVAERPGTPGLVGYHWTKVHDEPERLGEVYVVGVDPAEQGTGLGFALTVTGLEHLVARGVPTLMLYADESNTAAVRLYKRLGFTVASTDVTYER